MHGKTKLINSLLQFAEPALLSTPFRLLPNRWQHIAIEKLLNQLLLEQINEGAMSFAEGKILAVVITDLDLKFGITFKDKQLKVLPCDHSQTLSCTISVDSRVLLKLLLREADPDSLFFRRELLVEGDTAFGLQTKNLLDTIDIESIPITIRRMLSCYYWIMEWHKV